MVFTVNYAHHLVDMMKIVQNVFMLARLHASKVLYLKFEISNLLLNLAILELTKFVFCKSKFK